MVALPVLLGAAVIAVSVRLGVHRRPCITPGTGSGAEASTVPPGTIGNVCRSGRSDVLVTSGWVLPVTFVVGTAIFLLLLCLPLLSRRLDRPDPRPDEP